MATHCFYHSADLDGHCSGAIVKHFVPETILHPINYGDKFPWDEIKRDDRVYMVDFCLQPFSDMQRLAEVLTERGGLRWMDHHKTAIEEWQKSKPEPWIQAYLRPDMAGCEITWRYFRVNPPPLAVTLLGRYDVWDHSDPRTLPFQYRMRMEDMDPLKSKHAMELWAGIFDQVAEEAFIIDRVSEGCLLLRYADQENVKYCRAYAFETLLNSPLALDERQEGETHRYYTAICVNRGMTNSKVFDSVYDPARHHLMITFCRLPLHKQSKGGWTVSLYSTRDDVDCGAIAKMFGGGGHKGAAGFQCDTLPFVI